MTSRFSPTDEDRERLEGCRVVASVSGGKDSAALSLWLTEQGIDRDRIFADTGWEHPDTYAYLRGPLTEKLGIIHEVRSEVGGMSGRFGFAPDADLTHHDIWHSAVALLLGAAVYVALGLLHLAGAA